jgi:LemA protein
LLFVYPQIAANIAFPKISKEMKNFFKVAMAIMIASTLSSCGYNSMVDYSASIDQKWANVQSQYQRRADLLPSIIEIAKQYAKYEQETLTKVIEARSKATSLNLTVDDLTPENMAKFQAAQGELKSSMSRLLANFERYPDLKANEGFLNAQAEFAGTENRIAFARDEFNASVKNYNAYIRKFPQIIVSSITGFKKKGYFEADAGTEKAPNAKDLFKD